MSSTYSHPPAAEGQVARQGLLSTPFLFTYAAIVSWGTWGFLSEIASRQLTGGGLKVWAFFGQTAATFTNLSVIRFKVRWHPVGTSCAVLAGFAGSMGDLALYAALRQGGKSSILIPLTALAPAITVVMVVALLREKLRVRHAIGVALAIVAGVLLST